MQIRPQKTWFTKTYSGTSIEYVLANSYFKGKVLSIFFEVHKLVEIAIQRTDKGIKNNQRTAALVPGHFHGIE